MEYLGMFSLYVARGRKISNFFTRNARWLLHSGSLWIRRQIRRPRRQCLRIRLDLLHYFFDGSFQLRVLSFYHRLRTIFHNDVKLDSMAFDDPLAFNAVTPEFPPRDVAAVDE